MCWTSKMWMCLTSLTLNIKIVIVCNQRCAIECWGTVLYGSSRHVHVYCMVYCTDAESERGNHSFYQFIRHNINLYYICIHGVNVGPAHFSNYDWQFFLHGKIKAKVSSITPIGITCYNVSLKKSFYCTKSKREHALIIAFSHDKAKWPLSGHSKAINRTN